MEKKLKEPARDDPRWADKLWGMLQRIAAPAMIIMILGRATQLSYQAPPPPTPSLADLDGSWFWSVVGGVAGGGVSGAVTRDGEESARHGQAATHGEVGSTQASKPSKIDTCTYVLRTKILIKYKYVLYCSYTVGTLKAGIWPPKVCAAR